MPRTRTVRRIASSRVTDERRIHVPIHLRWGDLDGAWGQLDPAYKAAHPLTAIERERYAQVQVTGYKPLTSESPGEGLSMRLIEIGVVNRNTMTERTVRYEERWRYDAASKTWVVTSGLPDYWGGR